MTRRAACSLFDRMYYRQEKARYCTLQMHEGRLAKKPGQQNTMKSGQASQPNRAPIIERDSRRPEKAEDSIATVASWHKLCWCRQRGRHRRCSADWNHSSRPCRYFHVPPCLLEWSALSPEEQEQGQAPVPKAWRTDTVALG